MAYVQMLQVVDAEFRMSESGDTWQRGYALQSGCAQRPIRVSKDDEIDLSVHADYTDAVLQLGPP